MKIQTTQSQHIRYLGDEKWRRSSLSCDAVALYCEL